MIKAPCGTCRRADNCLAVAEAAEFRRRRNKNDISLHGRLSNLGPSLT